MRFFQSLLAGAAVIAAALAVEINDFPSTVEVGKSYPITYSPGGNAATTLILRKGDSDNLTNLTTLTTTATGGSYTWNVDRTLENDDDYALMIIQSGEANYIGPISVTGSTASASSSASASSTASASASKSSSKSDSTLSTITPSSVSASASASSGGNSTISIPTLSSGSAATTTARATGSGSPSSTGGGAPEETGTASTLGSSPLALIFGAVVVMAYLN